MDETIDIYDDSSQIEAENTSTEQSSTDLQLISLTEVLYIMQQASDYITETRSEFETAGPIEWIGEASTAVENALSLFRTLQIQYADDIVEYAENDVPAVEILQRNDENAADFDTAMSAFETADEQFKNYFDKHIELIKDQAGIE